MEDKGFIYRRPLRQLPADSLSVASDPMPPAKPPAALHVDDFFFRGLEPRLVEVSEGLPLGARVLPKPRVGRRRRVLRQAHGAEHVF